MCVRGVVRIIRESFIYRGVSFEGTFIGERRK